jgi:ABC-2 type transport system permease protein
MTGSAVRYLAFVGVGFQSVLRYRASFFVSVVTTATTTAVVVFLWRAVYQHPSHTAPGGLSLPAITTYLLVAQLLTRLHDNRVDSEFANDIMAGNIAVALVRPARYPLMRFCLAVPVIVADLLLVALPVLALFAWLFPLRWPDAADLALFAVAAACSVVLAFTVNLITGMHAIVTTNTWGVTLLKNTLVGLLSGSLIPVGVMPAPLARASALLPFRSMVDTPVRLFLGRYDTMADALWLLAHQALWTTACLVLCAVLWRRLVARIGVLGG